jgi:hypothetical protein
LARRWYSVRAPFISEVVDVHEPLNGAVTKMDLEIFKNMLQEKGVNMDYVSIGKDGINQMVIMPENNKWLVFFSEQGERWDLKVHNKLKDACSDFWNRISSSPMSFEKSSDPFLPG